MPPIRLDSSSAFYKSGGARHSFPIQAFFKCLSAEPAAGCPFRAVQTPPGTRSGPLKETAHLRKGKNNQQYAPRKERREKNQKQTNKNRWKLAEWLQTGEPGGARPCTWDPRDRSPRHLQQRPRSCSAFQPHSAVPRSLPLRTRHGPASSSTSRCPPGAPAAPRGPALTLPLTARHARLSRCPRFPAHRPPAPGELPAAPVPAAPRAPLPPAQRVPAAGCRRPRPSTPPGSASRRRPPSNRGHRPPTCRRAPSARAGPRAGEASDGRR